MSVPELQNKAPTCSYVPQVRPKPVHGVVRLKSSHDMYQLRCKSVQLIFQSLDDAPRRCSNEQAKSSRLTAQWTNAPVGMLQATQRC